MSEALVCEICGSADRVSVNRVMRCGHPTTACELCLRNWYEFGATDPAELRRLSAEARKAKEPACE